MANNLILNQIITDEFSNHSDLFENLDFQTFTKNIFLQSYQQEALKYALIALRLFYQKNSNTLINKYHNYIKEININEINRASFWMATGSGKTIVMIKLIVLLESLFKSREFIRRPIMLLVPNDKILSQFKNLINEYNNFSSKIINVKDLKDFENSYGYSSLLDEIIIYIARSDLIDDAENVGKDSKAKRLDYRNYFNELGWYIFLDEAHKGDSKDSVRKKYYYELANGLEKSLNSTKGFIFNFSATFNDDIDMQTCAFNYNLECFNKEGYGKNIAVLNSDLSVFKNNQNDEDKIKRIIEGFIIFCAIKQSKENLFTEFLKLKIDKDLQYHNPLMIAVSDKVNSKEAGIKIYFETILKILNSKIDEKYFSNIIESLYSKLQNQETYFEGSNFSDNFLKIIKNIKLNDLRKNIFYSEKISNVEACKIKGNLKELVFKSKNSTKPFLLLNIGDIKEWEREHILELGIDIGEDLSQSYFDSINEVNSPINIMIGSKVFAEGWDSNRVNMISFINIGSKNAIKYVLQTIGRGVRIEPFKNIRKRLEKCDNLEYDIKKKLYSQNEGLETLFIMASDEKAINFILKQIETLMDKKSLKGFKKINSLEPLFVPKYQESLEFNKNYKISKVDFEEFKSYLKSFDEDIFILSQNARTQDMGFSTLKKIQYQQNIEIVGNKTNLKPQNTFKIIDNFFNSGSKELKNYQNLSDEICHFNKFLSTFDDHTIEEINSKIKEILDVKKDKMIDELKLRLQKNEISIDEYTKKVELYFMESPKTAKICGYKLDSTLSQYYYAPLVIDEKNEGKIIYAIREKSEIDFLKDLKKFLQFDNALKNYEWCFCKLVENVDNIYIPYFDEESQNMRKFYPDFIFWLREKNTKKYKIFFIDPKGLRNERNALFKIEGFENIFKTQKAKDLNIEVRLVYYNKDNYQSPSLKSYVENRIEDIFK